MGNAKAVMKTMLKFNIFMIVVEKAIQFVITKSPCLVLISIMCSKALHVFTRMLVL